MINVGIVGATGYTGIELIRLIAGHPETHLSIITSRQHGGTPITDLYSALSGMVNCVLEPFSLETVCDKADYIFMALPHKMPMEIVPGLIANGKKVVDLSADFRFANIQTYEAYYQPHTASDVASQSVYGLSEIYTDDIKRASLIGNPGCYPTSILLPLIPLLREKLIIPKGIIADAKSGVSGAGRGVSLGTHFCEVNESFKAYKVMEHRHTPEIEEVLTREAGETIHLTFTPHLVPLTRGMLSTIYTELKETVTEKIILECLSDFYKDAPFVRVLGENKVPDMAWVRRTNCCDIGCRIDTRNNRLILVSAIDNLMKGASGQAVQNMNIMMGLDETTGLNDLPFAL